MILCSPLQKKRDSMLWENSPVNISDWTPKEIAKHLNHISHEVEEGKYMSIESVQEYFYKQYGYDKII